MNARRLWLVLAGLLAAPGTGYGQSDAPQPQRPEGDAKAPAAAPVQPEPTPSTHTHAQPISDSTDLQPASLNRFGFCGSNWLTVGLGYANNFMDDQAAEVHVGYSRFIVDEVEFNVDLNAWYFNQTGDDTAGINPGINLRWHVLHDETFTWSVYGEVGIGLLFAADTVPDGGTGFNFTPRAGVGATFRLDDEGNRLQVGIGWHHISNGRIEGDDRNPGRDSGMIYVGLMIPLD